MKTLPSSESESGRAAQCGRRPATARALAAVTALLGIARLAPATELYVAPDGNDQAAGTLAAPFATIQRAQASATPGDTVYVRGGTFRLRPEQVARQHRIWVYATVLDKSGAPGARIVYRAYRDEKPIFDFSDVRPPDGRRVTAFFVTGSWIHIKGLEVTGVQVTGRGHTQSICFENNGSNNIFEGLSLHDGQAIGIYALRGSNNLFLNCDAYRNHDYTSEDGKGGNVDGFGCHPTRGSTNNVFRGCRAWFNSDDGFDCIGAAEAVVFDHCWAFYNGYSPKFASLADGNGFKAGGYGSIPASRLPSSIPRHVIRFCIAARNKNSGFYANHHPGGNDWLNNTAYRNGANFNMLGRLRDNRTDVPGRGHHLRNNLSYKGRAPIANLDGGRARADHNSFDANMPLTDADFQATDESRLSAPRLPDGNLPATAFMRPARGSRLVDAGADIGFPFRGAAPDIGALECEPEP